MHSLLTFLSEGPLINTEGLTFFHGLIAGTSITCIVFVVIMLLFGKK